MTLKKHRKIIYIAVLALLAMLSATLAACGMWKTPLISLEVDQAEVYLTVGEQHQISVSLHPSSVNVKLNYKSSNETVAAVSSSGLIKALAVGEAEVTVSSEDGQHSDKVKVYVDYEEIEGITLNVKDNIQCTHVEKLEQPYPATFELTWQGNVPEDKNIEWFLSVEGGESRKLDEFDNKTTIKLTPEKKLGYYGQVYAKLSYGTRVYTSQTVYFGYFRYFNSNDLKLFLISGYDEVEEDAEGAYYIVQNGAPLKFRLQDWSSECNINPDIQWLYTTGDTEFNYNYGSQRRVIPGEKTRSLTFSVPGEGEDKVGYYIVYVAVDNVVSQVKVRLKSRVADVSGVTIRDDKMDTSSIMVAENVWKVDLTADWNKGFTSGTEYIEWFVNGELQVGQNSENFSYTPPARHGVYVVSVRVYNYLGSMLYDEASYVITVTENFLAIEKVSLELVSGSLVQKSKTFEPVTVKASVVYPLSGYNEYAPLKFVVNGVAITSSTDGYLYNAKERTLTFTPNSGETNVYAEIDNIKSNRLTFATMTVGEYAEYSQYLNNTYIWEGDVYNTYISYPEEFFIVVSYALMCGIDDALPIFIHSSSGININNIRGERGATIAAFNYYSDGDMGISITAASHSNDGKFVLSVTPGLVTSPVKGRYVSDYTYIEDRGYEIHGGGSGRSTLYIDSAPEYTQLVSTSNHLYRVLSWGMKPVNLSTRMRDLYGLIRTVVLDVCSDDMSELEKAHVLYDWLVSNVVYDYGIVNASQAGALTGKEALQYASYYLEGVFYDKLAVCDGISKAYCALLGMEGIKAVRVTGVAGGDHAWNKILIEADGSGVKKWWAVDATWANVKIEEAYNRGREIYFHSYFLITQNEISLDHIETDVSFILANGQEYRYNPFPVATNDTTDFFSTITYRAVTEMLTFSDLSFGDAAINNVKELAIALAYSYSVDKYIVVKPSGVGINNSSNLTAALALIRDGYKYSISLREYNSLYLIKMVSKY